MGTLKPGGNVDSWCGKCSMMLAHTIEAMVGDIRRAVLMLLGAGCGLLIEAWGVDNHLRMHPQGNPRLDDDSV